MAGSIDFEDGFISDIIGLAGVPFAEIGIWDGGEGDDALNAPVHVLAIRDGYTKVGEYDLQKYQPYDRRKKGNITFVDPGSFVVYAKKHSNPDETVILADENHVIAVFNHHDGPNGSPAGGWGDFTAQLRLVETPEWKAWTENEGKWLSQEQLGDFLELHATEITQPDAASVIESVMNVRAHLTASFRSGRSLRNGSIQVEYVEELNGQGGAGEILIPSQLTIVLRRWQGNFDPVTITAFVRFQIRDGKIAFHYRFPADVAQAARDAWRAIVGGVETDLATPVLWGAR